jgi:hypothetical protein
VLTPIVSRFTLHKDGRLSAPTAIVVPRDLLEPLDRNDVTIGTVEALDDFLTLHTDPGAAPKQEAGDGTPPTDWEAYRRYCDNLAHAVFPELARDERFERADGGFIKAGTSRVAAGPLAPSMIISTRSSPTRRCLRPSRRGR